MSATHTATNTWDTAARGVDLIIEHEYPDERTLATDWVQGKITCKNQGDVTLLNVKVKALVDDTLDFWDAIFYRGKPNDDAKLLEFGNIIPGDEVFLHYWVRLYEAESGLVQNAATYDVILIPSFEIEYSIKQAEKYRTEVK